MAEPSVILRTHGVSRRFPGVVALAGVDFSLRRGEIHALMGENGAGKSTLIKVLTGVEHPDAGTIELDGAPIVVRDPAHAQRLGISTVYQEVNLCPNLSVAENIMLGREPRRLGGLDWHAMRRQAEAALARLNLTLDVGQSLGSYSVATQQMIAIARALAVSARVLILDEPTSCLDANETLQLFALMDRLKAEGLGIIFITHFLDQVYAVADRISVLRHGDLVGCFEAASLDRLDLVTKMIGRELGDLEGLGRLKPTGEHADAPPAIEARGLGLRGSVQPFDLAVRPGEVVGLAGLLGSGRSEIARLLFGVDRPDSGTLRVGDKPVAAPSPRASLAHGVALCPENRRVDGIVGELTVRENLVLALQAGRSWFRSLSRREQDEVAGRFVKALSISPPDPDVPVKNLSGGNQQKVILGRWLATDPRVLILDEPTRGIDIGTKTEIQKLVLALAREGKAVVFISSELDEVVRCSERVLVLRDRRAVAELAGEDVAEAPIMRAIAGSAP